mmetsp:Transcript_16357/g.35567  ORF Transcript_16357/g.35567 Transcript_16357/m.35567 type:complete len:997 (+) Transcript_16357:154-3144(+)
MERKTARVSRRPDRRRNIGTQPRNNRTLNFASLVLFAAVVVLGGGGGSVGSNGNGNSNSFWAASAADASDADKAKDEDNVIACDKSTGSLLLHDNSANQKLKKAEAIYKNAMESNFNADADADADENSGIWSFGYDETALGAYREACDAYNQENDGSHRSGLWKELPKSSSSSHSATSTSVVTYKCDLDTMNVKQKTVEVYGIGECVANTSECRAITSLDLAEKVWKEVGLDCQTDLDAGVDGGDVDPDPDADPDADVDEGEGDASNSDSDSNTTDTIAEDADSNTPSSTEKEENSSSSHESNSTATEETDSDNYNDLLTPGSKETSGGSGSTPLPFLTDDDILCLNATAAFRKKHAGLQSAEHTYKEARVTENEGGETGSSSNSDGYTNIQLMGYPLKAAVAMRSACELNHGNFAFLESKNFTCVVEATETMGLHVYNFGTCLARTDECKNLDPTYPLLQDLADKEIVCWENGDKEGSGDDTDIHDGDDSDSGNGDADGDGDGSDNADADGSDSDSESDNTSESVQDNDGDNYNSGSNTTEEETTDHDESNANSNTNSTTKEWEGMQLTQADMMCMQDSEAMSKKHPELQDAIRAFGKTMSVNMDNVKDMELGFSEMDVEKLKSVCQDSSIDGYFTLVKEDEFVCDMMSVQGDLKVKNVANCVANTDACKEFNPLLLMENVWKSMGIKCREKTESDKVDSNNDNDNDNDYDNDDDDNSPSSNNTNSTASSNDNSTGNDNDENPLAKALGLTESEISCMSSSTSFVGNSGVLDNATLAYQKSVQMTDPTKLGYTEESAKEMKEVCKDQDGLWSFIESEDVTCTINGRYRCIHVYNFGNCIANNDDCQSMDPMVLVRGFFSEVLGFECRAKCDKHKETSTSTHSDGSGNGSGGNHNHDHYHPPSFTPNTNAKSPTKHYNDPPVSNNNNNNNLSSQQVGVDDGTSPSYSTLAVVLCVVTAVGFAGFYRFRASLSGRERIPQRDLELADMSDLRFETLT